MKTKALIITGPTATGKTGLAVELAKKFNGEIISADSRQVYRGLDIGTGKDLAEYGEDIKYHLIDNTEPSEEYSLYLWRSDFITAFNKILENKKLPIICGGTPLYLDLLLKNYELKGDGRKYSEADSRELSIEELAAKLKEQSSEVYAQTDLSQRNRILRALEIASSDKTTTEPLPEAEYLIIAPYWHRKTVHERIEKRLNERWKEMISETLDLLKNGLTHEKLEWFGLEYRYMSRFLSEQISEEEAFAQLLIKIRQFAKRQDIWFRKLEREGAVIHWLEGKTICEQAEILVTGFLKSEKLPEPSIKISEITYGPKSQ